MKPLVYLAGPIKTDPIGCVKKALERADQLSRSAACHFFVPQLSVYEEMWLPRDYEQWLEFDFNVIRHCDALFRMEGESAGADREVTYARELGKPVFFDYPDDCKRLYEWSSSYDKS